MLSPCYIVEKKSTFCNIVLLFHFETLARDFSFLVWVRGCAPLPRFFYFQGLVCLFYSKNWFIY
ncbi:hypothetical protein BREVNS_1266 [Brevinematales bacterium NS]|nr:hypothetical protein BREVNS_1266 [Brevinematales bacterium NS]